MAGQSSVAMHATNVVNELLFHISTRSFKPFSARPIASGGLPRSGSPGRHSREILNERPWLAMLNLTRTITIERGSTSFRHI